MKRIFILLLIFSSLSLFAQNDFEQNNDLTNTYFNILSDNTAYTSVSYSDLFAPFITGNADFESRITALENLPSVGISMANINNWNTAFGWGDHSTQGYLTSYTETDPIFSAWDRSTGIVITESQISDLTHTVDTDTQLSQAEVNAFEADPVFSSSVAFSITATDVSNWNTDDLVVMNETQTVGVGQTVSFNSDFSDLVSISYLANISTQIEPTGTIDPTNVSTGEANMINGNYTDLTYNNLSTGTVNKELPAIDLGASFPLSEVKVTWWTNNSYMASDYSIQGSNDGTTFTDIATGLSSSGQAGQTLSHSVSGSWQYIRVFCVQGDNVSWCVISELEAVELSAGTTEYLLLDDENFTVLNNSGKVEITNKSEYPIDAIIKTIK